MRKKSNKITRNECWSCQESSEGHELNEKVILGLFLEFRKATFNFVMSVRPHGTTRVSLEGFSWNLIFEYFAKNLSRKFLVLLKSEFKMGTSLEVPMYIYDNCSMNCNYNQKLFRTKKVVEKIKTRILFAIILYPNSCRLLYRVIHKSLRDFRTRLRNNQDRHGRKEHINR